MHKWKILEKDNNKITLSNIEPSQMVEPSNIVLAKQVIPLSSHTKIIIAIKSKDKRIVIKTWSEEIHNAIFL